MTRLGWNAILLLALVVAASAQFGGKKKQKPKAPVNKDDLKFIRCQVCEAIAKETRNVVKQLSEQAGPKKIVEADILERVEKMCNPDQNEGDWITMYDIVEQGTTLQLKDTGMLGKCKSECRTIARACEDITEDIDLTDLSAMLYKGKKRSAVTNWMCYESADACSIKAPPFSSGKRVDEAHQPMDEDEVRNIKMMRDMEAAGLSGSLYSRDTMEEELAEMQDMYGDDPDFNQLLKDTGMGEYVPKKPAVVNEPTSAESADSTAGKSAMAKLQEIAAKAADALKEGASKVVAGAKGLADKLFGAKAPKGTEL